jgi:hypothetical protein
VLAVEHKVRGFKLGRGRHIFKGDRNPQHDFLRRGSKAGGSKSKGFLWHVKNPNSMKKILVGKIPGHFSTRFSCFYTNVFAGYCQRYLVAEPEMIRTQMAKHSNQ